MGNMWRRPSCRPGESIQRVVVFWAGESWRGAFVVTGAPGHCLAGILAVSTTAGPRSIPSVSQGELDLILSDPGEKIERVPWSRVLPCKETWAFAIGKFLTDPIWWFYLFWLAALSADDIST